MSSNTELPPFGNDELARNFTLRDLYVRASISGSNRGSTSSPQSLNISKENGRTSVSESASNAAVGSEGSVLSTAKVPSNYEESVPSGEIVTIHVGSASSNATANGSGLASCSISNSAIAFGNYSVSATYAGDSNINGSSSTNSLSFAAWAAPSITSASTTSDAVGHFFSFQVIVTGFPTPTFSLSGTLPHGVSFNSSTGVLSGTPASGTTGNYTVTITANNSAGTTSQTFHLVVTAH